MIKIIILVLLIIAGQRYAARGEKQQRILKQGLRAGLVLGGIAGVIGLARGIMLIAATHSGSGQEGFAPLGRLLYGLSLGPSYFMVGFPVGFLLGAAREWWRQWAI